MADDEAFLEPGPEAKGVPNGFVPTLRGACWMESDPSGVPGRMGVAVAEV